MPTLFKLIGLDGASLDIDVGLFQQALSKDMRIASQEDGTYVTVDSVGLPALMLDWTDPHYVAVLTNKASFVELEARKVLASAL
ncbi:MAG: hypothetical protein WA108_01800 [Thiobacillus sp.]|jgi:hypothetical protein